MSLLEKEAGPGAAGAHNVRDEAGVSPSCRLGCLSAFIEAAATEGVIAGVQATLLRDLAARWQAAPGAACPCQDHNKQRAGAPRDAAAAAPTASAQQELLPQPDAPAVQLDQVLGAAAAAAGCRGHSSSTPASLTPELRIEPLNLQPPAAAVQGQQAASADANTPVALQGAAVGTTSSSTALMAGGAPDVVDRVAAAAAAMVLQQPASSLVLSGMLNLASSCLPAAPPAASAAASMQGYGGSQAQWLQAAGMLYDASTAGAPPPPPAAAAGGSTAGPSSGSRKQRFTKEQQAAILESVERNFALYPSRYTDLVIKELQAAFPGIEINSACVRKIKFRANEANKLQPAGAQPAAAAAGAGPQPECQAAAEAAHSLVGLAAAAAEAAAAAAGSREASAAPADASCHGYKQEAGQQQCQPPAAATAAPERAEPAAPAQEVACGAAGGEGSPGARQHQHQPLDSPTAAAAEAMRLLCTSSSKVEHVAVRGAAAVKLEPVSSDAAAGRDATPTMPSGKRKRQSATDEQGEGNGLPLAASALAGDVAAALRAVASLARTGSDSAPPQQQAAAAAAAGLGGLASSTSLTAEQTQALAMQHLLYQHQQHAAQQQQQAAYLVQMQLSAQAAAAAYLQQHHQPAAAAAAATAAARPPASKRQRLSSTQMAELVASVRHHVTANPERYTHCVIKDMKDKYPELELNMGQIRKIKFRTLGNANSNGRQQGGGSAKPADSEGAAEPGNSSGAPGGGCGGVAQTTAAVLLLGLEVESRLE